jgi:hypothetical protein
MEVRGIVARFSVEDEIFSSALPWYQLWNLVRFRSVGTGVAHSTGQQTNRCHHLLTNVKKSVAINLFPYTVQYVIQGVVVEHHRVPFTFYSKPQ